MVSSFYTKEELLSLNLKKFGENVLISKKCSIYSPENISIGDNVRIDDFCILSGNVEINNYVHISAHSSLYGKGGIIIGNFCGISPRSIIFSATDDFTGEYMISPMVPEKLTKLEIGEVIMEDYSQLGVSSIVMPKVIIKEGAVTGAFTLVNKDLKEWSINIGIPCRFYKNRSKNIIKKSEEILNAQSQHCLYNI